MKLCEKHDEQLHKQKRFKDSKRIDSFVMDNQ